MVLSRSPQLSTAIANVCREPATKIVSVFPDLDHEKISVFFEVVTKFLRDHIAEIGERQFVIKPIFSIKSTPKTPLLTSDVLINALRIGANLIEVDENFSMISSTKISLSSPELSSYSKDNECCLLFVQNGVEIVVYAKGYTLSEINLIAPLASPSTRKKFAKSGHAYKLSIIDHYRQRIRYGGIYSDYWHDRNKRILQNPLKKTEKLFHNNLQNWLDENLEGASVLGCVKKISEDETDIEIRLHSESNVYFIVEVKWLGDNGKTKYSESRLRDGIKQVNAYLQRDPLASEVCLVAYDGRQLSKFEELPAINEEPEQWKEISECQSEILLQRGMGLVFYLESRFASNTKAS
ncbi:MAG: hypothetical protein J0L96_18590 [Anaerolineae bacterium]|nr:hypothetical protein [Anaerolineae bacterium]